MKAEVSVKVAGTVNAELSERKYENK